MIYPQEPDFKVTIANIYKTSTNAQRGKGFEKIDSAILASAKSLPILNSEQVTTGVQERT